jgi:hypothetical protein
MARLSIYITDELKQRMDKVGKAVSWSEIARPVFLDAVAKHEHRRKQDMTTTIERLRASKEKYIEETRRGGKEAGRQWASDKAEYADLVRVANITDPTLDALGEAIDPEDRLDWPDKYSIIGLDEYECSDDEYVKAFIEGAQEMYSEIEDKL